MSALTIHFELAVLTAMILFMALLPRLIVFTSNKFLQYSHMSKEPIAGRNTITKKQPAVEVLSVLPGCKVRTAAATRSAQLTAADAELLEILDALSLTRSQRRFASEATRSRYLKAANGSADRASLKLLATLEWRASFLSDAGDAPRATHCELCARDPDSHCFFNLGKDARGWELIYCCPARGRVKTPEENLRHMCMVLEDAFDHGAAGGRFAWMIDLHGMGMADMDPRSAALVAPVLMQHYVGRLGQAVLLDAPHVFKMFWRTISRLLDAPTARRFKMLTTDDNEAYFRENLTPQQAAFMTKILSTRAAPGSYPPSFSAHVAKRPSPFRIDLDLTRCHDAQPASAVVVNRDETPPPTTPHLAEAAAAARRGSSGLCGALACCLAPLPARAVS